MAETMQLHTSVNRIDAVGVVRFGNPPTGIITSKDAAHLSDAIETLFDDPSVRALEITGAAPGVFIRHADVAQIVRADETLAAERIGVEDFLTSPFARLTRLCDMRQFRSSLRSMACVWAADLRLRCLVRFGLPVTLSSELDCRRFVSASFRAPVVSSDSAD